MSAQKIKENVYYVGAPDPDRKLFDELIPLPDGTSYNAYMIMGSRKNVLIESIDPPFCDTLTDNLEELNIKKIDYIVSHHAEQDHSGSLPELVERYPGSKIITNQKCKTMLMDLLPVSEDRFMVIEDGGTVSLGNKTLQFIFTPWVHWPETMSTYLKEDRILFSCDFFGSHYAMDEVFIKDEKKIYNSAKRYYAEIMMPFKNVIVKNLEKIKDLDIDIIAPSHGPIHDKPDFIISAYKEWISDKVKNEVIIPYVSMHGSTGKMVEYLKKSLSERGVTVKVFHLTESDIGELAMALVDAATVVIGAPTVLAGPHPNVVFPTYLIKVLKPKLKYISIIGSYGWGGRTVEILKDIISSLKVEIINPVVVKGDPTGEDLKLLDELAEKIVLKHKELKDAGKIY